MQLLMEVLCKTHFGWGSELEISWRNIDRRKLIFHFQLGLSNQTVNVTHPAKSTGPESSAARSDHLAVDSRSLPSQPDFGGLSDGSSLPKLGQPDPTMILYHTT